jgi:hypothetical protein
LTPPLDLENKLKIAFLSLGEQEKDVTTKWNKIICITFFAGRMGREAYTIVSFTYGYDGKIVMTIPTLNSTRTASVTHYQSDRIARLTDRTTGASEWSKFRHTFNLPTPILDLQHTQAGSAAVAL